LIGLYQWRDVIARLIHDQDEMVNRAVGWMARYCSYDAASNSSPAELRVASDHLMKTSQRAD